MPRTESRILVLALTMWTVCSSPAGAACSSATPPNIILFVADDLGWSDLPFFSPEIAWPGNVASDGYHYRLWNPTLNRNAARLQHKSGVANEIVTIDAPAANATATRTPIAYQTPVSGQGCGRSAAPLSGSPETCTPWQDALEGFGGLRKLADGAAFSRFYASSAVCSPTRASIFTGRHVTQHESYAVGVPIATHQVTIAEYLKQKCTDSCWSKGGDLVDCPCFHQSGSCPSGQCYTTGFIGKWHLGMSQDEGRVPWTQGFDEFIGFLGGNRGYFSEKELTCSPARSRYCSGTADELCESDGDCSLGSVCETRGLYVGPTPTAEYNNCGAGAATDTGCCEPTKFHKKGRYRVAGRGADRTQACNDNSGRASAPPVRRCIDDSTSPVKVKGLCDVNGSCPSGETCAAGPVCEGGTKEGNSCGGDAACACTAADGSGCKPGRCTKGCNFSERVYRDLAKDFIARHSDDGRPFFLVVSLHAAHGGWKTTERTKSHYDTVDPTVTNGKPVRPEQPYAAREFWGIIEEMDAAIGQIVDAAPANTFFLFVSDQGRPRGSYGNPVLTGGKRTTNEDGIRVGLLARACGASSGALDLDKFIGSQVDIFPTIAEAAGFDVSSFSPTSGAPPVLSSCERTGLACPCGPGDTCIDHQLFGKSFYDVVNRDTPATPVADEGSDFVFAKYIDGNAVVSKPGYYRTHTPDVSPTPFPTPFPGGVCGLSAARPGRPPSDLVRAGSCQTCDPANHDCSSQACHVLGNVCVTKKAGACVGGGECTQDGDCASGFCVFDLDLDEIGDRCGSCSSPRVCRSVSVACGGCMDASWKLKRKLDAVSGLWDVATNPEEDNRLACQDLAGPANDNSKALNAVLGDLTGRLERDLLALDPKH